MTKKYFLQKLKDKKLIEPTTSEARTFVVSEQNEIKFVRTPPKLVDNIYLFIYDEKVKGYMPVSIEYALIKIKNPELKKELLFNLNLLSNWPKPHAVAV